MQNTKTYSDDLEGMIDKIIENSSDFYIKLADMLSVEERRYLEQLIENKSCGNCRNGSCRVEHCDKVGLNEFGEPQGRGCLGWSNSELVGRQRVRTRVYNIK